MPISFPKQVEIVNWRLDLLQSVLTVLATIALAARFIWSNQYSKFVPIGPYIDVVLWPTGWENYIAVREAVDRAQSQTYCKSPQVYDYWWDKEGVYRYDNHSCASLCEPGSISFDCIHIDEISVLEPGSVYFVTQYTDELLLKDTPPVSRNHFVPTTDALSVGFTFSYKVPHQGFIDLGVPGSKLARNVLLEHSCMTDILTVILDSKGKPWRELKPPMASIELTANELFFLAGKEGALDSPNVFAGANMKEGSTAPGPIGRISGLQINLKVECYNYKPISYNTDWDEDEVCYIQVQLSPMGWASLRKVEAFNKKGESRNRLLHGVRVKALAGGHFQFPDSNNILLNITSALVLLGLVRSFMLFIAVTCLGHVSNIYRRVIYERFIITEQVGGMATRLMAHSVNFVELQDTGNPDGGSGTISKQRMAERLKQVVRHRHHLLDAKEIEAFVMLCYMSVVDKAYRDTNRKGDGFALALDDQLSGMASLRAMLTGFRSKPLTPHQLPDINIDHFSMACASQDMISFDDLVKLFDRDRHITCLERFFWPSDFQFAMQMSLEHTGKDAHGLRRFYTRGKVDEAAESRKKSLEGKPNETTGDYQENARPPTSSNPKYLSLEKRKEWYWQSVQQVQSVVGKEAEFKEQAEQDEALLNDLGTRIDRMEDFLHQDLQGKLNKLEEKEADSMNHEKLIEKCNRLTKSINEMRRHKVELEEKLMRAQEAREADRRDTTETMLHLEERLLVLESSAHSQRWPNLPQRSLELHGHNRKEEVPLIGETFAAGRRNEDAPTPSDDVGVHLVGGPVTTQPLYSNGQSDACGEEALKTCIGRRKARV